MSLKNLSVLTVTAALAVPLAMATPVPLPPGGTVTFAPTMSSFSGTFVTSTSMTFSNPFENGTVNEDVYRSGGTLDFYYQVVNNASSPDSLSRITVSVFSGYTTAVDYLLNGGDAPTTATRQAVGDSVGFYFTVSPGTSSDWLEVATNATAYDMKGAVSLIDTQSTYMSGEPEPAAIPEPLSLGLISGGLLIIGVARHRALRKPPAMPFR